MLLRRVELLFAEGLAEAGICPSTTVKDLIESCGVPHTEVDLILVNEKPVGFNWKMQPEDRVSIYSVCESSAVAGAKPLQEGPLRSPRFVADVHLGRLARNLRLLGFDVSWQNSATDLNLLDQMRREDRCLLTRDRKLLMRKEVSKGYCVRSDQHAEQTVEVIRRFALSAILSPFTRCARCNRKLRPVPRREIESQLEPLTRAHYQKFVRCEGCGRVYWEGSHMRRLRHLVKKWRRRPPVGRRAASVPARGGHKKPGIFDSRVWWI